MRLVLFLIVALASCDREPTVWSGLPEGTRTCGWDYNGSIGTCIVEGRAYQCVSDRYVHRVSCAPSSPIVPAEMPK